VRAPVVALVLALLAPGAAALRCPDGVVAIGDHKVEVLDACGEPLTRDQVVESPTRVVTVDGRPERQTLAVGIVTEEWIYEFSPQRFRQLLRFRGNRLREIQALDKPD
jgi:hypothetical protein